MNFIDIVNKRRLLRKPRASKLDKICVDWNNNLEENEWPTEENIKLLKENVSNSSNLPNIQSKQTEQLRLLSGIKSLVQPYRTRGPMPFPARRQALRSNELLSLRNLFYDNCTYVNSKSESNHFDLNDFMLDSSSIIMPRSSTLNKALVSTQNYQQAAARMLMSVDNSTNKLRSGNV
jgi:hypothetical protein